MTPNTDSYQQTHRLFGLMLSVLATVLGPSAYAQSYTCGDNLTETEEEICYQPELSALDVIMADTYEASFDHIDWMTDAELKQSQRSWLIERNACLDDQDCIRDAYIRRLKVLAKRITDFDTRKNYTAYAYAGEPKEGKCEDGASLSDWGQCVYWANGTTTFRGVSADGDMAYSFWYIGSNMHSCNIEGAAQRTTTGWVAKHENCEVTISFEPHGLEIKTNGLCDDHCGMRARGMIDSVFEY